MAAKGNPFGKKPEDNPFLKGKKKAKGKGNLAPPFGKKKK